MDQPIIIKFNWTAEDLIQAHHFHFRQTCRPVFRFGLHFIFALMILGGVLGYSDSSGGTLAVSIGYILGGVYWFVLRRFERRWIIRRQFAKRADKNIDLEWQVHPDRLMTRSCIGHSEFGCEAIVKVVRTPLGIMFYSLEQFFHWLPRRGFESDADFEKLCELAKCKVKRFYSVA